MNQILDYNPNNNKSGGNSSGSDKVVKIFAIFLVIFALGLLISGGIGIYKNKQTKKSSGNTPTYAKITAEQNEQGNKVTITVTHDKAIEEMFYSWNTSAERSVKGTGEKTLTEEIDVPAKTNTLHVKVIDVDGIETSYEHEFTAEDGLDIIPPKISLDHVDSDSTDKLKKLKITAPDESTIDFITYRWNEEEEIKVEAEQQNQKEIVIEIDILKGKNNITVVAVDSSNNTTIETKSFNALTKPEVLVNQSPDGSQLIVQASHENGIAKIYYTMNGQEFMQEYPEGERATDLEFHPVLYEGYNRFILTVTSSDGTETVFDGECQYNPQPQEAPPAEENQEQPAQTDYVE